MRRADFDVAWKGCQVRSTALYIDGLTVDAGGQLATIALSSRVTAFVGVNGVGKTGLMRRISSTLSGQIMTSRASVKEVKGIFRGKDFSATDVVPMQLPVELFQPSMDAADNLRLIRRTKDLDDIVGQYQSRPMSRDDLALFKKVVGIDYNIIDIKELERATLGDDDGGEDEEVVPYFSVTTGHAIYDSRDMGLGELCAFYVIWRLLRAKKDTVVILDEPDSHLSPRSRAALIDVIGFVAHSRNLVVLFTTHSIEMVERLRREDSFMVSESAVPGVPTVGLIASMRDARLRLNLRTERTLLVVVEDVDALCVVSVLINRWAENISQFIDVVVVTGGDKAVSGFCSSFPVNRICSVVAILDGDKRAGYNDVVGDVAGCGVKKVGGLFLPSNQDPVVAIRILIESDPAAFALRLGVAPERVSLALKKVVHVDHHDFIADFLDSIAMINIRVADMRLIMVSHWLDDPVIAAECEHLAASIAECVP